MKLRRDGEKWHTGPFSVAQIQWADGFSLLYWSITDK